MKNLLYLFALVIFFSCSKEEFRSEKEINTPKLNSQKVKGKEPCINPVNLFFFNENWVSSSTPYSVDISWEDNFILTFECEPMVGQIEIFADGVTDPNTNLPQNYYGMTCYGNINTPVNAIAPIDFFNTSTYTLTIPDFGIKCLWWRIVLKGGSGCEDACATVSPWHFVSTYDL